MIRTVLFIVGSIFFLYVSRRSLLNPQSHGFFRFFVFEGILALVLLNHSHWFSNPFTVLHLLSWLLLITSICFVIQSLMMLKQRGGYAEREDTPGSKYPPVKPVALNYGPLKAVC